MQEQSIIHVINELNYNCQPIFKLIDCTVKVLSFRNVFNSFLSLLLFNSCVFISANTFELCVCILIGIATFSLLFAPKQPHCGPKYIKNKADLMVRVWNSNSQLRQVAIQICSISRYIRFMLDSGLVFVLCYLLFAVQFLSKVSLKYAIACTVNTAFLLGFIRELKCIREKQRIMFFETDSFLLQFHPASNQLIKIVTIYENQRWWFCIGWCDSMLKNERDSWSDGSGTLALRKELFLINNWNWIWHDSEWMLEVHVGHGKTKFIFETEVSDSDGWQYGKGNSWKKFWWKPLLTSAVRRRRWARRMVYKNVDAFDEFQKLKQNTN